MGTPHTIAVAGKGGVGKTTTCGMIIDYLCIVGFSCCTWQQERNDLDQVQQAGFLGNPGHVVKLVEGVQVDAVDAAGAVLVDLPDGILDAGLLEAGFLFCHIGRCV